MPTDDPNTAPSAAWQDALLALLGELEAATTPSAQAQVFARVAALEPDLQRFLIDNMLAQASPDAAAFLQALAVQPATPADVRAHARAASAALDEQGIAPPPTGQETFYQGWIQQGRERGEQIMLLGWRLGDGRLEALVFLLDWRGDGLKDFYRTREISSQEWRELVDHNSQKGAPLVAIALGAGRALLEDVLAEGKRFSRPVPRDFRLAEGLIEQRILSAAERPADAHSYINPALEPAAVVESYIEALHHRDYLLMWHLLAPEHLSRQPDPLAGVEALRRQGKHAPRRRGGASIASPTPPASTAGETDTATVMAQSDEEKVEPNGRRVRLPVRERYTLRRGADGWRITAIEREAAES